MGKMRRMVTGLLAAAMVVASTLTAAADSPAAGQTAQKQENVTAATTADGVTAAVNTTKAGNAILTKVKKTTNEKNVKVASKVKVNGVKYTVTVVASNAFKKCTKATKITLPKTIVKINKKAFTGAKKLKTIVLNNKKSITVTTGAFKGLNTKEMKIVVNKNMSAKQLKQFKKVLKRAGFDGKVKKA